MHTTNDHELSMPDLLELDLLQLLHQESADMVTLKKLARNFVNLLVNLFDADLEQANCRQDIKDALVILSERLNELTANDPPLSQEVD